MLDRILPGLSAATITIAFIWLVYFGRYGLDLGDDGCWLNNPFAYGINIPPLLLGFICHWPYQWADGGIAVLGIANVPLTIALGWSFSFLVIRRLWTGCWAHTTMLSAGIASRALVAFQTVILPSHNYYKLRIQSAFTVKIGLLLADSQGLVRQTFKVVRSATLAKQS
ncbi:hypothetical protein [Bradyrhizobium sp. Ec3.3]|uniref:hypothetical protein n=1 Tax=Bradyrhizobium sp. Ec3.3 TaxID=189753 RepID=UPI0012EB866B|nr:hypothetical protein [Bradyrhizobium sp. Ec3.3]